VPGQVVALVKPQFEAGRAQVGKGGVVRDLTVHRQVLNNVISYVQEAGLGVLGLIPSPIKGPAGNYEFLLYLGRHIDCVSIDIAVLIENSLAAIY